MGKKQQIITEIFNYCEENKSYEFDNNIVKEFSQKHQFKNPFDATKFDNSSILPTILKEKDFFIIHLGEGRHKFIENISKGFHNFEVVDKKDIYEWKYRQSILNDYDTSESNILSVGFNQRIIHNFLYDDIVANPKMYNSKRTKISLKYKIANEEINTKNLQIEIDFTTEYNGNVTIFEGKNNFPKNFAIYQLFLPYLYYFNLKNENRLNIENINCCYLLRKKENNNSIIKIYLYTFENPYDITTIKLLKNAQYNLIKR